MTESQSPPTPKSTVSSVITNPYVGIAGVFLGAGIATMNARLLSVGLTDLRGALGFGQDETSWLPTALNMASMFSGVFVVFLNSLFGTRRILLPAAAILAVVSALLPFSPTYACMLAGIIIAGVSSGTFYSLTMTFVLNTLPKKLIIFGIAAYAAEIVFTSNIAFELQGLYSEHLSWRWIFWSSAILTPVMIVCVYFGIPFKPLTEPRPSWRGFAYLSLGLSLIYGALDQGERLDWLHSGTIVALCLAGVLLLLAALCRRLIQPNPTLSLSFLNRRNTIVLALAIFAFRFVQLATVVLIPGFLANVDQYRPLQTGHALAWVALPMFAVVWIFAFVIIYANSRLILALGLTVVAVCCWFCSRLDTTWYGHSFELVELFFACGFACSFIALIANLVLQALEAGALTSATKAATYSGFVHFIRLFGGQVGTTVMLHFISAREKIHSNLLGLHVQAGDWLTEDRLHALAAGLTPVSSGQEEAQYRAIGLLARQLKAQAYTLAISDGFILITWVVVGYLALMLLVEPAKLTFKDLGKMK